MFCGEFGSFQIHTISSDAKHLSEEEELGEIAKYFFTRH